MNELSVYSNLREKMANKELPAVLSYWKDLLLAEFPRLKEVEISLEKLLDGGKLTVGGTHLAPDGQYPHEILLRLGGLHELPNLKKERATAFLRYARLLGVPVSEITPEIYNVFIFLHEMGHAVDFMDNYEQSSDFEGLSAKQIFAIWDSDQRQALGTLPVPDLSAGELTAEIRAVGGYENFLINDVALKVHLEELNIFNQQELLDAQQSAYRDLPQESAADRFAANFIRQHWSEFKISLAA